MIFGQALPGADPKMLDKPYRTQNEPYALMQSGVFADIQPWQIKQEWIEECACPDVWETVDETLDIVRCTDGC